ncbi:MAG: HNH endonuclease [Armatimonadetes bacterium]|nr:HNH endonuclease [Armatimonadota bacterium]
MHQVLVLNLNYEPLNICSFRRALGLLFLDKATVLETNGEVVRSERLELRVPSVVRLNYLVKRPRPELRMSRRSVLARDAFTCQYCGRQAEPLTIDHVVPRVNGGAHTWENLVCSCIRCNNTKGHRTPAQAGMKLLRSPRRPRFVPHISFSAFARAVKVAEWQQYLEPFAPRLDR